MTMAERCAEILQQLDKSNPKDKLDTDEAAFSDLIHHLHDRLTQIERKPKMVMFPRKSADPIYVRPERILFIHQDGTNQATWIDMGGTGIWVYCSVEQALEAIEAA